MMANRLPRTLLGRVQGNTKRARSGKFTPEVAKIDKPASLDVVKDTARGELRGKPGFRRTGKSGEEHGELKVKLPEQEQDPGKKTVVMNHKKEEIHNATKSGQEASALS